MKKAVVLSSGGIDSTTCIPIAINDVGIENVVTVSVLYGQKHSKELDCANKIAEWYKIPNYIIDFTKSGIFDKSDCALLDNSSAKIVHKSYAEQIGKSRDIVNTYVPFRNGLILSAVASLSLSLYPDCEFIDIYIGVHSDDYAQSAYADCSIAFIDEIAKAIKLGTYDKVNIKAPFVNVNKAEIVHTGLTYKVPYNLTWSCYEGGEYPCGTCATCIDRLEAFRKNGILEDPCGKSLVD